MTEQTDESTVRDIAAALAFLYSEELGAELYEQFADLSANSCHVVGELVAVRQDAREVNQSDA